MFENENEIPVSSDQLQTTPAYYAFVKATNTIGYFALLDLTWRFIDHKMDLHLGTGCVLLSAGWLIMTRIKSDHLLQTYFDVLSRIEMQLPVVIGIAMSIVAMFTHSPAFYRYCAIAEIFGWLYIYILYQKNKAKYKKQGHGPVPKDTWINPPASVLQPGDLILTSGNVATELHESVGHAEMVLKTADGELTLFSSYMAKGAMMHPLVELTGPDFHGHYIALHLRQRWSEKQSVEATALAQEMIRVNKEWADRENHKIARIIGMLPLPKNAQAKLITLLHATGYDWFGTFMGRIAPDRWTCIGACVELYKRMGTRTNYYGTGLFGVGTTIFDPILPVRFLSDPAFDLIKATDTNEPGNVKAASDTTSDAINKGA